MKKYIAGGATAIAIATSAVLMTQVAFTSTTAALPEQNTQVVAQGLDQTLTELAAAEEARKAEEARLAAEAEAARQAEAARNAEEARKAAANKPASSSNSGGSSRPTTNDSGIAGSAYTGPYFDAGSEGTRKCIVKKESGGNYGIVSSNGMYHGAYQFSRSTGDNAARKMGRADLVGTPVSQWSRAEQDQAFWTTWNHGAGSGNWPTARGC